ncbi:MAG: carbohydrate ABC transporter permease [Clostridia bacterium]
MKRKKLLKRILHYFAIVALLAIVLFPFYMMIITAFKQSLEAVAFPPTLWPSQITLQHFADVLNPAIFPFGRYALNSLCISLSAAFISTTVGGMAAYSITRLEFPGRMVFKEFTLMVYMFSGILLVVPLYRIISSIGLNNTFWAVIIADTVSTLPAAIYMLSGYFATIPIELEEAAMVDGMSRIKIIVHIVLPLSVPAVSSTFIYVFMIAWNEFLFSFTFLSSRETMTLALGLKQLFGTMDYVWGRMMAASLLMAIPVVCVFTFCEKSIASGLVAGGVKG